MTTRGKSANCENYCSRFEPSIKRAIRICIWAVAIAIVQIADVRAAGVGESPSPMSYCRFVWGGVRWDRLQLPRETETDKRYRKQWMDLHGLEDL